MANWRDLAAQRVGPEQLALAELPLPGIDTALAGNLRELEHLRPPRGIERSSWTSVVRDALALARGGWAATALTLGWSELDLFGIGPAGSSDFSGLAVWLRGRQLILLNSELAIVRDGTARACFNRGGWGHGRDMGLPAAVPLWRFGRV